MNEFPLILRTLLRNRAAALLTIFQVALTLAVLVNVFASSDGYRAAVSQPMGIAESGLVAVSSEWIDVDGNRAPEGEAAEAFHKDRIQRDMELLRRIPGVQHITATNGFPLSDDVPTRQLRIQRDDETSFASTFFIGDAEYVRTLGLDIVSGRDFSAEEVQWSSDSNISEGVPVTIVSQALADKLFPKGDALNRQAYAGDRLLTIVGIVKRLPGLHPLWSNVEMSFVVPGVRVQPVSRYLLLADRASVNDIVSAAESALYGEHPQSLVTVETQVDIKTRTLSVAMSTVTVLGFVSALLLIVTALGCYGQTTFTVTKRTREIGIRRAIGATKGQIIAYFLIENWLMTTAGIVVGVLLTYVLNVVLVQGLGAAKVTPAMIAPGVLFLWGVGLLSALLPALRASFVPPAMATRTV